MGSFKRLAEGVDSFFTQVVHFRDAGSLLVVHQSVLNGVFNLFDDLVLLRFRFLSFCRKLGMSRFKGFSAFFLETLLFFLGKFCHVFSS